MNMLKNAIFENVTGEYMYEVENNQEFKEVVNKMDEQIQEVYKKYNFEFGEQLENYINQLISIAGDEMYIKGLKDGIKL